MGPRMAQSAGPGETRSEGLRTPGSVPARVSGSGQFAATASQGGRAPRTGPAQVSEHSYIRLTGMSQEVAEGL